MYSLHNKHAFLNYGNRMWPQITESDGDRQSERPSDGNRLLLNALRGWPAGGQPALGDHKLAPASPVKFEAAVDWDRSAFAPARDGVRGILGLHSSYSDGRAGVAQFARAARQARPGLHRLQRSAGAAQPRDVPETARRLCGRQRRHVLRLPRRGVHRFAGRPLGRLGRAGRLSRGSFVWQRSKYPVWDGQRILHRAV